ncbi:hypothetical protein [Hansschlegelia sp. KR7-227]|uniref:hypothetical protein n=1 Tax=Hansschlegelia sp. KR7-227 TaxID=3400914 RepID=UPI003BFF0A12
MTGRRTLAGAARAGLVPGLALGLALGFAAEGLAQEKPAETAPPAAEAPAAPAAESPAAPAAEAPASPAGQDAPAAAAEPVDTLSVPGPLKLQGVEYALASADSPSPGYVRQGYLPKGETLETYDRMVMVEVVLGDLDPSTAAAAKVRELGLRKATDPTVNSAAIRDDKTGEVLLDFTLSGQTPDGVGIAEWNAYRYSPYKAGDQKGVVLFALSRRAYGDKRAAFFKSLKKTRPAAIKALIATKPPAVKAPSVAQ